MCVCDLYIQRREYLFSSHKIILSPDVTIRNAIIPVLHTDIFYAIIIYHLCIIHVVCERPFLQICISSLSIQIFQPAYIPIFMSIIMSISLSVCRFFFACLPTPMYVYFYPFLYLFSLLACLPCVCVMSLSDKPTARSRDHACVRIYTHAHYR